MPESGNPQCLRIGEKPPDLPIRLFSGKIVGLFPLFISLSICGGIFFPCFSVSA